MSDDRTVTFKLNGKRPDDFTIDRLAAYLSILSELVGSSGKVRVNKLTPGSVKVQMAVAPDHYPKFVQRLTAAKNPTLASASMRRVVATLEEMISDDHVTAEVTVGATKLFYLRGYSRAAGTVLGPVIQRLSVRGNVIGLEGKDATKHVRIAEYGSGREIRGEFRDDQLAVRLTSFLWGPVVELSGMARLLRHPDGTWELKSFRVDGVQTLDDASASDVFRSLRDALNRQDGDSGAATLKKLRG